MRNTPPVSKAGCVHLPFDNTMSQQCCKYALQAGTSNNFRADMTSIFTVVRTLSMLAGVGDIKGGVVHWRATCYMGRPDREGVHETARQSYESRGHNRHEGRWYLSTPNVCQLQSLVQQYGIPLVISQTLHSYSLCIHITIICKHCFRLNSASV